MTNSEKFKEVFGVTECEWMTNNGFVSTFFNGSCSEPGCNQCIANDIWWNEEYAQYPKKME